jgi:hypothetical protein
VASGELSPWSAGSSPPSPNPYQGSYDGPWGPAPTGPPGWPSTPPPWPAGASGPVSDEQLRRLPPPVPGPSWSAPARTGDQRPAVVALAVTLAVTGALVWVCALSLVGLVALVATRTMARNGDVGVVFHALDELVLRMGDGLWVPLYGFPVASIVTAFLLLGRRPWSRIAHSAVGLVALGWAAWWLRDSLLTWVVVAVYVATAVAVLWTPAVGRWYATRPARSRPSGHQLHG